jgi:hypothetical protein
MSSLIVLLFFLLLSQPNVCQIQLAIFVASITKLSPPHQEILPIFFLIFYHRPRAEFSKEAAETACWDMAINDLENYCSTCFLFLFYGVGIS